MPLKLLMWAETLLGSGHMQRAAIILRELDAAGFETRLLSGANSSLESIRAEGSNFKLVDQAGRPVTDAIWQKREEQIDRTIQADPPDLLLIEMWPFGRRQFSGEIERLIEQARTLNSELKVFASVRDILVTKNHFFRYREMRDRLVAYIDLLLIHGSPELQPFGLSFPYFDQIGDRACYTGFVADRERLPDRSDWGSRSGVVVSAGGGAVGTALLRTCLALRMSGFMRDQQWTVLAGKSGDADGLVDADRQLPGDGALIIKAYEPELPKLFARSALSISQAGYNSCVEIMATGVPAVLVPFCEGGQDEQMRRALMMRKLGRALVVDPAGLGLNRLLDAARHAVSMGVPSTSIDDSLFDGAGETARIIKNRMAA